MNKHVVYDELSLSNLDNSIPYSFVTFDVNSGHKFLCIKNNNMDTIKFEKMTFERNKNFVCRKINSEIFSKGLRGELFYEIENKPHKIHIETPGFFENINNNSNKGYDLKKYSKTLKLSQNFKKS